MRTEPTRWMAQFRGNDLAAAGATGLLAKSLAAAVSLAWLLSSASLWRATADVSLASCFSDNMVLPAGGGRVLSGTVGLKEKVTVQLAGKNYRAKVRGRAWSLDAANLAPGGPYSLRIVGKLKKHESEVWLTNVVVGQVWVVGVQTNAGPPPWWPSSLPKDTLVVPSKEEVAAIPPPFRNHCRFQIGSGSTKVTSVSTWEVCTPETAARSGLCSMAYCFAGALAGATNGTYLGIIQVPVESVRILKEGSVRLTSLEDEEGKTVSVASDIASHRAAQVQAGWDQWCRKEIEARKAHEAPAGDIFLWKLPTQLVRMFRLRAGSPPPAPLEVLPLARGAIW